MERKRPRDGPAADPRGGSRVYRQAQRATVAPAQQFRRDPGRQETARGVEGADRLDHRRRLVADECRPVDAGHGEADLTVVEDAGPGERNALDDLDRLKFIQQGDATAQRACGYLGAAIASQAEKVRQRLAHLAHQEGLADARLGQVPERGIVQFTPVAREADLNHGLADERVRPALRGRRVKRIAAQGDKGQCEREDPSDPHQKACRTRTSSA